MSTIELRPRFERRSDLAAEDVIQRLEQALTTPGSGVHGVVVHGRVYLSIPKEDQHFWSPQLSLEFEKEGEETQIKALFGPNPNVWLMFIFFYFFLGFLALVVLIIGGSRWNLGLSAGILWFLPILLGLIALAFFSARAGQKLAKDQMWHLYDFMNHALEGQLRRVEE